MTQSHTHHSIDYIEIYATDIESSRRFYEAAFDKALTASLTSVREAGGTIVKEPFPFPGGCRFQFLDPAGNELAVWSEENGL